MVVKRNRTSSKYVGYGLYLYFLGLSYRNTSKALSRFVKRSHVSIWKWIQKYRPKRIKRKRKRTMEFIIDETMIKIGSNYMWIWVAIEPESKEILGISVSKERNMLIAERFISSLTKGYGKHSIISTDGGTWYPQACQFLKLNHHHIHSSYEKSLIERTMQYIKDRTESFDDYFHCRKENCRLKHVQNWLTLFLSMHNKGVINA